MATMDEKVEPIYQEVLARNPGETEFHQAVREVLESLGPVLVKHPEFAHHKIIEPAVGKARHRCKFFPRQGDINMSGTFIVS